MFPKQVYTHSSLISSKEKVMLAACYFLASKGTAKPMMANCVRNKKEVIIESNKNLPLA